MLTLHSLALGGSEEFKVSRPTPQDYLIRVLM